MKTLSIEKLKYHLSQTDKWQLIYTLLLFINNFAYGISVSTIDATLSDLRFIYSVSLDSISRLILPISVGYLIGSLSSYLYKWVNRQLGLIFFCMLMAIGTSMLPHYGHLWIAFVMMTLNGIGSGAWDSSVTIWLVELWPKGNAAMLQANMFMAGLGTIVWPLFLAPFVHGDANVTSTNETITTEMRIQHLTVPFTIEGVLQTIVPLAFLILYFVKPYQYNSASQNVHKNQDQDKDQLQNYRIPKYRKTKIAVIGLCAAIYVESETGYTTYSTSMWETLDINLSAQDALHVLSVLTASFTAGRLVTAFVSLKLKPDVIIMYHFGIIITALLVLFFGRNSLRLIYVGNALLGFGFSAMWPAMFAFTENHLRLTPQICSLFSFMSGVVSLILPSILGQLFNEFPLILFIFEFAFVGIALVLFIVVLIWIRKDL